MVNNKTSKPAGRKTRAAARSGTVLLAALLAACSALLPRAQSHTYSPWQSYAEAEQTFNRIVPHQTTVQELKDLKLDPKENPNITILNYSDVLRRFLPSPSINAADLDSGVKECIEAKTACHGYEVTQASMKRTRYGVFLLDFFNFRRRTDVAGWRFNGVILIKNDVVIYKLTGGQPAIHENEDSVNPLGPLQGIGGSAPASVTP
ncbi:MAG: hypothetical protein WCA09_05910 [Burkholderiales bacterium]